MTTIAGLTVYLSMYMCYERGIYSTSSWWHYNTYSSNLFSM